MEEGDIGGREVGGKGGKRGWVSVRNRGGR